MEQTMCEMMLRLPLFQGMSSDELFEVIERMVFTFRKYEDGKLIYKQSEPCKELAFLMKGTLLVETEAHNARLSFTETLIPYVAIEPQSLFGMRPHHKATYIAQGEVSLFCLDKQYLYTLLREYEVFRINFFNLLASKAEKLHERLWDIAPRHLEGRLALFIRNLCTTPQGPKVLRAKMDDLAALLDDTRLNVSRILNKWMTEGLMEKRRMEFIFPNVERLPHDFSTLP